MKFLKKLLLLLTIFSFRLDCASISESEKDKKTDAQNLSLIPVSVNVSTAITSTANDGNLSAASISTPLISADFIKGLASNQGADLDELNKVNENLIKAIFNSGRQYESNQFLKLLEKRLIAVANLANQVAGKNDSFGKDIQFLQRCVFLISNKIGKFQGQSAALMKFLQLIFLKTEIANNKLIEFAREQGELKGLVAHHETAMKKLDSDLMSINRELGSVNENAKRNSQDIATHEADLKNHNSQIGTLNGRIDELSKGLNSSVLGTLSINQIKEHCNNLEILSLAAFPAMKVANNVLGKIPILGTFTTALENTFLKILIASVLYRGAKLMYAIKSKSIGLSEYQKEKMILGTLGALIITLKFKSYMSNK